MLDQTIDKNAVLDAIRQIAQVIGHSPSRAEFKARSGLSEYQVLQHFPNWREAVRAAGLEPDSTNVKLEDETLLDDWGDMVRRGRQIPTRHQYRRQGKYSPGVFEKHFGPWSSIPAKFREYAKDKPQWLDVLALIPQGPTRETLVTHPNIRSADPSGTEPSSKLTNQQSARLDGRPTYGNPIDFRGLRHEPVNEQGVVFLFGVVARELGYMVEAVQAGFPDCEAKRQVASGRWQRVRIEFEFESRNFRDHGHPPDGCDVIVCWRHNWPDCPPNLEVVELSAVIESLAKSED
ncbi:homing endonuclease associated repeat-containing protein [Candidatus Binatus sp.]|uniref:homing endonuclease associated repeat-containing protein n=1 Tax=Candidatus Binatus sp. TaxID=2811406 RepID=UPI003F94343F